MIIIDGCQSSVNLKNHATLNDVFVHLLEDGTLESRIVTDVYLNDEAFSELYPHQSEDIETSEIDRLELKTVSSLEMASNMLEELPKVLDIMAGGSRQVASLLRRAELAEAFEMLQDLIALNRDFLGTIDSLRAELQSPEVLDELGDTISNTLGEIADVMGYEDWVLVADLLEYEFIPACDGWRTIIDTLNKKMEASRG